MRNLIPITCLTGVVASVIGFIWYDSLPTKEKEKADRLAEHFAMGLFGKNVDSLTPPQAEIVEGRVHRYLNSNA